MIRHLDSLVSADLAKHASRIGQGGGRRFLDQKACGWEGLRDLTADRGMSRRWCGDDNHIRVMMGGHLAKPDDDDLTRSRWHDE
ncbi:MAG: hypothetical protein ABIZ05_00010 [Pseudonocardiaceae bacterium]